ncbi:MAG TPA: hypothetical protein VN033_05145 [Vulgatibacter sp.]|nr:hypothetical protein [Vulgatibacter sp.]
MQLVDLILQGVKGFPAEARLAFGPGLVVLRPAETELRKVLDALLYPDDRLDDDLEVHGAPASRAALTLRTRDGGTWRMVRDLRGGSALQRLDDSTGRFATVSTKAAEIGPYLRSHAGLPSRTCWTETFTLGFGDFPSATCREEAPPAVFEVRPAPAPAPPSTPPDPDRIRALEEELRVAKEIEALEFKLDSVRGRILALDERFKAVPPAEAKVEAARRASAFFREGESLPDDLAERTSRYDAATERRDSALARLAQEAERLHELAMRPLPLSPARDWRVWASVGAGAAALAVAIATTWKPLALLGIPAFGMAAALGLVFVGELQRRDSVGRRQAHLSSRERRIHEQWDEDTREVRAAMETIGAERVADLDAWLADRAEARRRLVEAEEALRRIVEDPSFIEAKAQRERLQAEAEGLEDALEAKGAGSWRSSSEIARELGRLRNPGWHDEVAEDPMGAFMGFGTQAPVAPSSVSGPLTLPAFAAPDDREEDPSARLLERAAELGAESRDALLRSLAPRASAYLEALSRKRLRGFAWSEQGGVRCAGDGGEVPFLSLGPADRDLAWLALRLAIVERHQARSPLPLVLDEPLTRIPTDRHPLLAKMLRGLAGRGQVIHATRLEAMADGSSP